MQLFFTAYLYDSLISIVENLIVLFKFTTYNYSFHYYLYDLYSQIAATIIGTGLVFMPCSSFAATIPPKDPSLSTPVVIEKKAKYSIGAGKLV